MALNCNQVTNAILEKVTNKKMKNFKEAVTKSVEENLTDINQKYKNVNEIIKQTDKIASLSMCANENEVCGVIQGLAEDPIKRILRDKTLDNLVAKLELYLKANRKIIDQKYPPTKLSKLEQNAELKKQGEWKTDQEMLDALDEIFGVGRVPAG